jgi:hypothetical protein
MDDADDGKTLGIILGLLLFAALPEKSDFSVQTLRSL